MTNENATAPNANAAPAPVEAPAKAPAAPTTSVTPTPPAPVKTAPAKKAPVKTVPAKKAAPPRPKAKSTKPAVAPSPAPSPLKAAAKPAQPAVSIDVSKAKLVRDSFTMPQHDFALIAALKDRALGFKRATKKSELLRAGLHALQQLSDAQLRIALNALTPLKAGRPKKKA